MRYNININQSKAVEWELSHSEALTFDIFVSLSTWAKPITIEWEVYYYCSAGLLIKELPLISKSRWTFLWIIKKLKEKELIDWVPYKNKSYYRLSNKWKEWCNKWMTEVSEIIDTGVTKSWDNNNTNIITTSIIENIYKSYFSRIPQDKKKYTTSAKAKLYIWQLLRKEWFTEEQLMWAIDNYYRKTSDKKYVVACQYFFSNTEDKKAKHYRLFIDYMTEEPSLETKKLISVEWDLF